MKKLTREPIQFMLVTVAFLFSGFCKGQEIKADLTTRVIPAQTNIDFFSHEELNKQWSEFSQNKNWKILEKAVAAKKFSRILNKEASWGFSGTTINDKGEKDSVLLCLFDFLNPANIKQGCSMLWAKVGRKTYKAYIIFPEGEKDINKKFELTEEWYVDETKGTINKASSWGRTFKKCVQRGVEVPGVETELSNNRSKISIGGGTVTVSCPGICLAGAIACTALAGGVATSIVLAGIVAAGTEGVGIPVLIAAGGIGAAMLVTCVGASCVACVLMCALGAL
jgi:hypothetical protein